MNTATDLIYFSELHSDQLALLSRMHIELAKYSAKENASDAFISKRETEIDDLKRYTEAAAEMIAKLVKENEQAVKKGYNDGMTAAKKIYTGEDLADRDKEAKRAQVFCNAKSKWQDHY